MRLIHKTFRTCKTRGSSGGRKEIQQVSMLVFWIARPKEVYLLRPKALSRPEASHYSPAHRVGACSIRWCSTESTGAKKDKFTRSDDTCLFSFSEQANHVSPGSCIDPEQEWGTPLSNIWKRVSSQLKMRGHSWMQCTMRKILATFNFRRDPEISSVKRTWRGAGLNLKCELDHTLETTVKKSKKSR